MKKSQTKTSKPAATTTPKQKPRTLKDATSPSATINDIKNSLAQIRQIIAASQKKQDECIDVINKHDRDIIDLKRAVDNNKVSIDDSVGQNSTVRFMIVTTVLIAVLALMFAGSIAHASINSLKESLPQTTTYDTTTK